VSAERPTSGPPVARVLILVENLTVPFDRRVWLESRALTAAGYQVSVICPTGGPHTEPYELREGVHIYRYPEPAPTRSKLSYVREFAYCWLQTARLSLQVARERGFDAIHACNPPDTFWLLGRLWRLFRGTRFVFDQHDLCPEVYLARFGGRRGFLHHSLRWLEARSYATADLVVATNESYREVAMRRGRVAPGRVVVVRSGPEAGRFRGAEGDARHKRGRPYLVGYIGVMAPQDGVDYLLRAARAIRDRGRDDVAYTLIGSGDSFEDLRRLATQLGLDEAVRFTGRIPDEEVEEILSAADVCVGPDPKNPLNDLSTMNKIMEYMALGKPVVAFDLKETRFSAGEGALYATPNREEDLADKILELLDDPARRRDMGAYNRRRFRERLAWEFSRDELVRAYDALLGVERRSRPGGAA
jgi:glycosyltransferase involved in cell wall biosynthesis